MKKETEEIEVKDKGLVQISRRKFLKVLGAASAVGAAGCASDARQNILPYAKPDPEQIPGVAVWYSSTCTECSAGCGIRVRTREGRAVKIEGNPLSPVNRGSLCGLGQASLQNLYDPDRVRQPLKKKRSTPTGPEWEAISWDEALGKVAEALQSATNKKVFLTGELNASHEDVVADWCKSVGFEQIVYDVMQPVAVAKAAEMSFGTYGIPTYAIDKAEVVLNFGADFMETWGSPCLYSRQWADSRRSEKPLRFVHVEPRLSLTGANADMWLKANPGEELQIVLYLIRALLDRGRGQNVRDDIRTKLLDVTKNVTADSASSATGVSKEKLLLLAQYLIEAKTSLVLGGGTSTNTQEPLPLLVAINLLNMVLENVGTTVLLASMQQPKTSVEKLLAAIDEMKKEKVDVLFVYGTNPAFTFPEASGLKYAMNSVSIRGGEKKAGLVVSFSSHMDETSELADLVLPIHTPLEDWGYARPYGDSVSLMQPTMTPIFETKGLGDLLISLSSAVKKPLAGEDVTDFEKYVKVGYSKLTQGKGNGSKFWIESLERGGYFSDAIGERARVAVDLDKVVKTLKLTESEHGHKEHGKLQLYPFPSVKSFDGRAANRPWLQELADPITQVVWDSWAEIHPDTAKRLGIAQGDMVTMRNDDGECNAPAFLTEYVHPGIVAVPLGQGHTSFGRYAKTVGAGSVYTLLPAKASDGVDHIPTFSAKVEVMRSRVKANLVTVQGSDSQLGRELARTSFVGSSGEPAKGEHGEEHGHGEHHGPVKQMYQQREHPLYQWGLNIDLAACTGCSACVVACYAENNIPVVGKEVVAQGREMTWLRIERYYDPIEGENGGEEMKVSFLPMMCQHCQNAPCEPVCPVYATYHNEDGMNSMIYNRCVGTRYCSNNCSYKVRRFNWFQYDFPELLTWQLNPDVTKRTVGVMEKCTFCVQRIQEAKDIAKDLGRMVKDGDVQPACVQGCPTKALTFGNLKDADSVVSKLGKHERAYKVLDEHINTQPSVSYLEDIRYKV